MPPPRTRLVRRAPLLERIQAYLNPWDFLLWASEELNGNDWGDIHKRWAVPIGIVLNVVFMMARANARSSRGGDDVFADYHERRGSGWLAWVVSLLYSNYVHIVNMFLGIFRRLLLGLVLIPQRSVHIHP